MTTAATALLRVALSTPRPWPQLLSPTHLTFPPSLARLTPNLTYFTYNYTILILITLALSLLPHPLSLLALLATLALWFFLFFSRDDATPIVVFGFTVEEWVVVAGLVGLSVLLWWFVGFWRVVVGLVVGGVVVGVHACLRETEDLGEEEGGNGAGDAYGSLLSEAGV